MDIKPRWGPAYAVPLPSITSTASGLVARHLGATTTVMLCLAVSAGVLCLVAIVVQEYADTRRAGLLSVAMRKSSVVAKLKSSLVAS